MTAAAPPSAGLSHLDGLGAQLHRRRAAAWRLPPLDCGRRDPLDRPSGRRGPSDYGLSARELASEQRRLAASGRTMGEIAHVLVPPPRVEVAA